MADDTPETVLHTPISPRLETEIAEAAKRLKVPVQNLVRDVLEDAFRVAGRVQSNVGGIVTEIVKDASGIARTIRQEVADAQASSPPAGQDSAPAGGASSASGENPAPGGEEEEKDDAATHDIRHAFPDVIGWMPMILNQNTLCDHCDKRIYTGETAYMGASTEVEEQPVICEFCLPGPRRSGQRRKV
ncbi:MAG: hypothetical protein GMKNLPBB_01963 [Myxococcota bacterium]|nr:hypothetical protein [Myxococcota bacterium]